MCRYRHQSEGNMQKLTTIIITICLTISTALPASALRRHNTMIHPQQLRSLIADTLRSINMYSESAVELLMLTAAQESHCGRWIGQVGGGPAQGIFQMEPATLHDLWTNFLKYRKDESMPAKRIFTQHYLRNAELNLRGNMIFQIVAARLQYYRFPAALPPADDVNALAAYYKQYWNTSKGAATVQEAITNYGKYA